MTPSSLLECLRAEGFTVKAVPQRGTAEAYLLVDPGARLTAERATQIKACRAELIALLLSGRESDAEWEAKGDAIVRCAQEHDPFADGPVALVEYELLKVSGEGEPPYYVATRKESK